MYDYIYIYNIPHTRMWWLANAGGGGEQKALKAKGIDAMLVEARKNSKDLDMDIGQGR